MPTNEYRLYWSLDIDNLTAILAFDHKKAGKAIRKKDSKWNGERDR